MRFKPLKRLDLILSLSKDEDAFSGDGGELSKHRDNSMALS
jgi:hypothetical protein